MKDIIYIYTHWGNHLFLPSHPSFSLFSGFLLYLGVGVRLDDLGWWGSDMLADSGRGAWDIVGVACSVGFLGCI